MHAYVAMPLPHIGPKPNPNPGTPAPTVPHPQGPSFPPSSDAQLLLLCLCFSTLLSF